MSMDLNPSLTLNKEPLFSLEFNQSGLKSYLTHLQDQQNLHSKILDSLQSDIKLKSYTSQLTNSYEQLSKQAAIKSTNLLNILQKLSPQQSHFKKTDFETISIHLGEQLNQFATALAYLQQKDQEKQEQIEDLKYRMQDTISKSEHEETTNQLQRQFNMEIQDTKIKIDTKIKETQDKLLFEIQQFKQQMQELEKKTLWKIQDCSDLLSKRPNIEFVQISLNNLEEKLNKQINQMSGAKFSQLLTSSQQDIENKISQLDNDLTYKIKLQKKELDNMNENLQTYITGKQFKEFQRLQDEKVKDQNKKLEYFEKEFDPAPGLNRLNGLLTNLQFRMEESENSFNRKIGEFAIQVSQASDPATKGMVFLPQNNIDPHQICQMDTSINRIQFDFIEQKQEMEKFKNEFKTKMNYIQSEILVQDNTNILKIIPKKDDIIKWVQEAGFKGTQSSSKGIDNEKLEEIICDLIDLKKKTQSTKELENRYQRIFQEMNVNSLTKQVSQKADYEEMKTFMENIILELQQLEQKHQQFRSDVEKSLKLVSRNFKSSVVLLQSNQAQNQSQFQKTSEQKPTGFMSEHKFLSESQQSFKPHRPILGRPFSAKNKQ